MRCIAVFFLLFPCGVFSMHVDLARTSDGLELVAGLVGEVSDTNQQLSVLQDGVFLTNLPLAGYVSDVVRYRPESAGVYRVEWTVAGTNVARSGEVHVAPGVGLWDGIRQGFRISLAIGLVRWIGKLTNCFFRSSGPA